MQQVFNINEQRAAHLHVVYFGAEIITANK